VDEAVLTGAPSLTSLGAAVTHAGARLVWVDAEPAAAAPSAAALAVAEALGAALLPLAALCHAPALLCVSELLLGTRRDATLAAHACALQTERTLRGAAAAAAPLGGASLLVPPAALAHASHSPSAEAHCVPGVLMLAAVLPLSALPALALAHRATGVLVGGAAAALAAQTLAAGGAGALVRCAAPAALLDAGGAEHRHAQWACLLPVTPAAALLLPLSELRPERRLPVGVTGAPAEHLAPALVPGGDASCAAAALQHRLALHAAASLLECPGSASAAPHAPHADALTVAATTFVRPRNGRAATTQWQDPEGTPPLLHVHAALAAALHGANAAAAPTHARASAPARAAAARVRARAAALSASAAAAAGAAPPPPPPPPADVATLLPVPASATACALPASHAQPAPDAASPRCSSRAAAVATAAAMVCAYLAAPEAAASPVGEFAESVVAAAVRVARDGGASLADVRCELRGALLRPAADLAARHPRGCDPRAKRREYTLQALLTLWLSLEDCGERSDECDVSTGAPHAQQAPRESAVTGRCRAAVQQAAKLLAPCALLLPPLGAEGLAHFCALHVTPRFGAVAPATTQRLLRALNAGRDDARLVAQPVRPPSPPAEEGLAQQQQPDGKVLTSGRGQPRGAVTHRRGNAPLRLRQVTVTQAPPRRGVQHAAVAAAAHARNAVAETPAPAQRPSRRAALPAVAAAPSGRAVPAPGAGGGSAQECGGSSGSSGSDGADEVVPCTAPRRAAPLGNVQPVALLRNTPPRRRATRLFGGDGPAASPGVVDGAACAAVPPLRAEPRPLSPRLPARGRTASHGVDAAAAPPARCGEGRAHRSGGSSERCAGSADLASPSEGGRETRLLRRMPRASPATNAAAPVPASALTSRKRAAAAAAGARSADAAVAPCSVPKRSRDTQHAEDAAQRVLRRRST
jgi:hypothetical protein